MKRTDVIVVSALLALVAYAFTLSFVGQVFSPVQTSRKISNSGEVKAIGVGVYWDYECASSVSSIDWGIIEPGSSRDVICYIRNEGNSPSTLSMYTSNWNPSDASVHITLSWDHEGQSINPNEVVEVTFTLSISASIEDITGFSFDITVVGSG